MTGSLAVQPFDTLLGTGTLLGACHRLGSGTGTAADGRAESLAPSARLASRLRAFAINAVMNNTLMRVKRRS